MKNYKETKDLVGEINLYKKQIEQKKLERMSSDILHMHIRYCLKALGLSDDINLRFEVANKFREYESKGYDYDDSMELVMWFIAGVSGITNRDKIENAIFAVLAYDPYFKYEVNELVKNHFLISLIIFIVVAFLLEWMLISALLALTISATVAFYITLVVSAIIIWRMVNYFSMLV